MTAQPDSAYLTLLRPGQDEYIVQKSRFICDAIPCDTEEGALRFLQDRRARYRDATHHCYAYIIGRNAGIIRFSDDGEPSGTAGLPMMEVLRKKQVVNCCVVITRYFGGILLGAGGLVRAYAHSCAVALEAAGVGMMHRTVRGMMSVPYPVWDKVQYQLNLLPVRIVDTAFGADVEVTLAVRLADQIQVETAMTESTNSQAEIIWIGEDYELWPLREEKKP